MRGVGDNIKCSLPSSPWTEVLSDQSPHAHVGELLAGLVVELDAPHFHVCPFPIAGGRITVHEAVVLGACGCELSDLTLRQLALHLPQPFALLDAGWCAAPVDVEGRVGVAVEDPAAACTDALHVLVKMEPGVGGDAARDLQRIGGRRFGELRLLPHLQPVEMFVDVGEVNTLSLPIGQKIVKLAGGLGVVDLVAFRPLRQLSPECVEKKLLEWVYMHWGMK